MIDNEPEENYDKHLDDAITRIRKYIDTKDENKNKIRYAYLYIAKYNLVDKVLENFGLRHVTIDIDDAYSLLWLLVSDSYPINNLSLLSGKNKDVLLSETNMNSDTKYAEIAYFFLNKKKLLKDDDIYINFKHPYNAVSFNINNLFKTSSPYKIDKSLHKKLLDDNALSVIENMNYTNMSLIRDKLGILIKPGFNNDFFNGDIIQNLPLLTRGKKWPPFLSDREKVELYGLITNDPIEEERLKSEKGEYILIRDKEKKKIYYHEIKNQRYHGRTVEIINYNFPKKDVNIQEILETCLNESYKYLSTVDSYIISCFYKNGILDGYYYYISDKYEEEGLMLNGRKHERWKYTDARNNTVERLYKFFYQGREVTARGYVRATKNLLTCPTNPKNENKFGLNVIDIKGLWEEIFPKIINENWFNNLALSYYHIANLHSLEEKYTEKVWIKRPLFDYYLEIPLRISYRDVMFDSYDIHHHFWVENRPLSPRDINWWIIPHYCQLMNGYFLYNILTKLAMNVGIYFHGDRLSSHVFLMDDKKNVYDMYWSIYNCTDYEIYKEGELLSYKDFLKKSEDMFEEKWEEIDKIYNG